MVKLGSRVGALDGYNVGTAVWVYVSECGMYGEGSFESGVIPEVGLVGKLVGKDVGA